MLPPTKSNPDRNGPSNFAKTELGAEPNFAALLDEACLPYRRAGRFAYRFARGKLRMDPAYRAIFELGLLRDRDNILDLGCGQGLLMAWLRAASALSARGEWPPDWPPAPDPSIVKGIELMASDVARARYSLGADCGVVQGDIRTAPFGTPSAVVILDVLHYMDSSAQQRVLERVRAALAVGGLLLLRVGDSGSGLRFRFSQWVDSAVMLVRGHAWLRTHCRSVAEWRSLLACSGFDCAATPMSRGTPFANVLLIAQAVETSAQRLV